MKIVCFTCRGHSFRFTTNETGVVSTVCLTCERRTIVETLINLFDDDALVDVTALALRPD
jgi:hypothetical protein